MLETLYAVERELPRLLASREGWSSLRVDYHPPHVDRVFRAWGAFRVYLHRILPCAPGAALFHPHPWPSAMRVLAGTYEMGVGFGSGATAPPLAARLIARGPMEYEMTEPDAWHYVRPIDAPAMTVMVTGAPWSRDAPRSPHPLAPLPDAELDQLLAYFRAAYPLG